MKIEREETPKENGGGGSGKVYAQIPEANIRISANTPVKIKID